MHQAACGSKKMFLSNFFQTFYLTIISILYIFRPDGFNVLFENNWK